MKGLAVGPTIKAALAVIFWGASFVATKIALREVQPLTVVWVRFAMGVLVLGLAVVARKEFAWPARGEWGYFALLGFLGITLHQWLQSNALETSQATTSAWIVATSPVFIALLSWLFLREQLDLLRVTGIALAALGVLLVVTRGELGSLALGQFGAPGDILVLASAINWAVFTVLSRRALNVHSPALLMFYVIVIGWILISVLFFFTDALADITRLSIDGWLAVGFLGVFCSGLANIFWYDALKQVPASQVGVFLYLEPLVTLMVAAAILAENLTLAVALGGAAILLGVWLVNRPRVETLAMEE